MPSPSEYKPTTHNPKKSSLFPLPVKDLDGSILHESSAEKYIDYVNNGNSYIGPMITVPSGSAFSAENLAINVTAGLPYYVYNGDFDLYTKFLKDFTPGKRCIGFNFVNGDPEKYYIEDALYPDNYGITGLGSTLFWRLSSGGSTYAYGYRTLWNETGITLVRPLWDSWLNYVQEAGSTIDSVMFAAEGGLGGYYYSRDPEFISGLTKANAPWFGLTSYMDLFREYYKAPLRDASAWAQASSKYKHYTQYLTYFEPFISKYPDGVLSNYLAYDSDPHGTENHGREDNIGDGGAQGLAGNASSPGIYGTIRLFDREVLPNSGELHYLDPRRGGGSVRTHTLDQYTTTGAWLSFMCSLSELRMVKRNAYNNPQTPWILNVSQSNLEYNIWTMSQETIYQAPKEVLNNTWYRKNMSESVYGYGGFVGNSQSVIKGIYGYYGAIPGFTAPDGSTTAIMFDTGIGTSRTPVVLGKCELRYYYDGLCAGNTYIVSYYINLNAGYTSNNVNFTTYEPSYTGITYYQTLPVIGGPYNGETGIAYNSGDSGWTKVEWKFNAPDNTTLNAYFYSVTNGITGEPSRKTYVWDLKLQKEASPSNINIPIVPPYHETERVWRQGPPAGMSDVKKGYNPKQAAYFTKRGGNSGYYYEFIRHCCLQGCKGFGYFNATMFIDHGATGTISVGILGSGTYSGAKVGIYHEWGKTGFLKEYSDLDNTLKDAHSKIGGFTLTTALTGFVNWRAPYIANAAPDITGNTWWWRVTVRPGFTMNCHGVTLHAPNNLGTWIPLSTPDEDILSDGITWQEWPRHPHWPAHDTTEPSLPTPTKEFNFLGMTSNDSLIAQGITFSRGSSASYIDSNGLLKIAGINQARFTHDPLTKEPKGLILESGAINELCWSETFGTTGGSSNNWEDFNLTRSYGFTSPSGMTNAIRFRTSEGNGFIRSTTARPNGQRTFSIWLRGITGNEKVQYTIDGGTYWYEVFGLTTQWKRFDFTSEYGYKTNPLVCGITYAEHQVGVRLKRPGSQVEMWGAQLESRIAFTFRGKAECASSYIPTAGITAQRIAESCSMSGTSVTSWLGLTYGTIIFENEEYPTLYFDKNENFSESMYLTLGTDNLTFHIRGRQVTGLAPGEAFRGQPYPYTNGIFPTNFPLKTIFVYSPDGLTSTHCNTQSTLGWTGDATNKNFGDFNRILWSTSPGQSNFASAIGRVRRFRYWNTVLDDTTCLNIAKTGHQDPYLAIWNPYDTDPD